MKTLKNIIIEIQNNSLSFLLPNTEIEIFDNSSSAPEGGVWLDSRIRKRITYTHQGKTIVGYEVSAPWKYSGTTDVEVEDYGRTWRLKGGEI